MATSISRIPTRCTVAALSVAALLALMAPAETGQGGRVLSHRVTASAVAADASPGTLPAGQLSTRYTITIDNVSGGADSRPGFFYTNNVTVSGNVSASNYSGQMDQYHVRVDWGDGTETLDTWLQLTPGSGDKTLTGVWRSEPAHTYAQSDTYTITAVLYHQRLPGADRSEVAFEMVGVVVIVPPAIAGVVFNDANANGTRDATEGGIGGVPIGITGSENRTTTTSPSGFYHFDDLTGGNYTVVETNLPGYVSTTADTVAVHAEANAVARADFGDSDAIAFLGGTVFNDENGDGVRDPGEAGIFGVKVSLDSNSTAETDESGQYSFTLSSPGDYNVSEEDLPGYYSTTPNTVPVTVALGYAYTRDFGDRNNDPGTSLILGIVFNDTDGDGVHDEGEPGIGDTLISLAGTADSETVTLSDGTYYFPDLDPGAYIVRELNLPAYNSTTADEVYLATVADTVYRVNFGDVTPDSYTGFIFGTVFNDANGNGLRELGELGMPGVAVSCNLTDNTTTSEYGQYTFRLAADGDYTVRETDPDGYYSTTPNVVVVPLALGQQYPAVDFGDTSLATCSLSLTPENATNQLPADTDELFTATVLDQNGAGIPGLSVTLETTFGSLDTASVVTGGGGTATCRVSSDVKGTATITATLGPLSDNSTCTWFPPTSGGGGGGGGSPPSPAPTPTPIPTPPLTAAPEPPTTAPTARLFEVDFLEKVTTQAMSAEGRLVDDLDAPSPDGTHRLRLSQDTRTLDPEGDVVSAIKIRVAKETPPLPAGTVVVGDAYDFTPSGITFDGRVRLTLGYAVGALPGQVRSMRMAVYTPDTGWADCETESGVAGVGSLTARVQHFSVFAVLATTDSAETQANGDSPVFGVANLRVAPSRSTYWRFFPLLVMEGTRITVTADATNSGGLGGTWDLVLSIDGKARETAQIALDPLQTRTVVFNVRSSARGGHTVQVAGLSAQFVTTWTINWWLLVVVALVLAVAGWVIFLSVRRRRVARARGRG